MRISECHSTNPLEMFHYLLIDKILVFNQKETLSESTFSIMTSFVKTEKCEQMWSPKIPISEVQLLTANDG